MISRFRSKTEATDPYRLHRLALLPLQQAVAAGSVASDVLEAGLDRFPGWVERHGLMQVWREYLAPLDLPAAFRPWLAALRDHARLTAAHQMRQHRALQTIAARFEAADIAWFLFKGADLRNFIYPDPLLRPVSDLDLFVRLADRRRAIEVLRATGYDLRITPETVSHEVTLLNGAVAIDLHWHLFRPGRARPGLGDWLFARRERHQDLPGLDATASLLVMLVHPAVTKYLLSPTSMLIHQFDLARLIGCGNVDWAELESALTRFGTRTAAWSSLYVLEALAGVQAPERFIQRIQPGIVHRTYLRQWIDRAWISRWFGRRWLVAGLFSLALQDSALDVWRAWRAQRRARSNPPLAHLA